MVQHINTKNSHYGVFFYLAKWEFFLSYDMRHSEMPNNRSTIIIGQDKNKTRKQSKRKSSDLLMKWVKQQLHLVIAFWMLIPMFYWNFFS